MSLPQLICTVVLIVGLLALAAYYAWRQKQTLHRLKTEDFPEDERRYLRGQAWRRLAGSVLMVIFAALLAGSFFIEGRAQELVERREAADAQNTELVLNAEDRRFRDLWAAYWAVLLLGVLVILALAAYDFWATRRYGLRNYRQLQADRRAMIARELAQLRRDRNGPGR
jgi:ABC-type Fe3+ transport system permease subunit